MSAHDALPKAETAVRKALEIDETLAEPHVSLGHVITITTAIGRVPRANMRPHTNGTQST